MVFRTTYIQVQPGLTPLCPICRLSLSEQEKVIMDEYKLGWAARAERVNQTNIGVSLIFQNGGERMVNFLLAVIFIF